MADSEALAPDHVDGVPHPRHTARLLGHGAPEDTFLSAFREDRLHHAWLITGARGVGKATLAWRLARFLLATPADDGGMFGAPSPPETLDIAPDHPVAARISALSEPGLFLMRPTPNPTTGTMRRDITVDVARTLKGFLQMSATDGGRRVVLIDAADQLNTAAANAILKLLEEPPDRTTFLLVCHAPARLLPTIRSRCRVLPCAALAPVDLARALAAAGLDSGDAPDALAELAAGSVGEAARLLHDDGVTLYGRLVAVFATCPDLDRAALLKLANGLTGAVNAAKFDITIRLINLFLVRLARHGAGHPPRVQAAPDEAKLFARLAPDARAGRLWADLQQQVSARLAHGRAVNLDPSALILDTGLRVNETGRKILGP